MPLAPEPIVFAVPGAPKRKTRPRFRLMFPESLALAVLAWVASDRSETLSTVVRRHVKVTTYTDPETQADEEAFGWACKKHRPTKLLAGPLRVDLLFVIPIPSSWSARDRAAAAAGALLPISRPDRDNYEKLALDAMTGIMYVDDAQVCAGESRKIYGVDPRTEVRITPIIEGLLP